MSVVALTHGYPPFWNMGGEVSLHRQMAALPGKKYVLTPCLDQYEFEGVTVLPLPKTIQPMHIEQNHEALLPILKSVEARAVLGQNELSYVAVRAAAQAGIAGIVNVHTPVQYGNNLREALLYSTHGIYNTETSRSEWRDRDALVLHPPVTLFPERPEKVPQGTAYTLLSNLAHKGVGQVLELARRMPEQEFIIVRSPAEPTHGYENFDEEAAGLPNVTVGPRVAPEKVAEAYFSRTRILLVPSRYETYGMSAIEAAGYGIPSVHIDTAHAREGIGEAAQLIPWNDHVALRAGIDRIESDYAYWSTVSRSRAEFIQQRQTSELRAWVDMIANIEMPKKSAKMERTRVIRSGLARRGTRPR